MSQSIYEGEVQNGTAHLVSAPIDKIEIPTNRLRRLYDPSELAENIRLIGLMQPITITESGALVMGRHRLEAARMLGWENIPAFVVEDHALVNRLHEIDENLKRKDLNVLEYGEHLSERESVLQAIGRRAAVGDNQHTRGADTVSAPLTTQDLAAEIEKSGRTIRRYKRIAERIYPEVREAIHALDGEKDLPRSTGQLLALSEVEEEEAQLQIVEMISSGDAESVWDAKRKLAGSIHFKSESPDWYTPPRIIERVVSVLGAIDLDPCADEGKGVPASEHYTWREDGLLQRWSGRVYMNPPYGKEIPDWIKKLKHEFDESSVTAAIALVPARTDTEWFAMLREHPRCFLRGRLKFSGHQNSAPFPSAVFYLGPNKEAFLEAFLELGDIYELLAS